MKNCPFCELTAPSVVLYENKHCMVIPDIAPLVAGHVLIVPRKHIYGIARCDDEIFRAILQALFVVKKRYGDTITIFEHGSLRSDNAGSSISHAHLHVIPIKIDLKRLIDAELGIKSFHVSIDKLNHFSLKNQPYLFAQNNFNAPGIFYCVGQLQRQFLRRLIFNLFYNGSGYDWEHPHQPNIFKKNYNGTMSYWNTQSDLP